MSTKYYLCIHVLLLLICGASLPAQTTTDGYFDPERDPVLSVINGKMRFMVSEDVMVRAVDIRVTKLGQIETIYKKQLYEDWYIFIEGREKDKIEQSIVVVLKLKKDEAGNYFADHSWYACVGDSCGSCGYDETNLEACFCKSEDPNPVRHNSGYCYSLWSNDPLFYKTPLKIKD
jgi:hypothetical protein